MIGRKNIVFGFLYLVLTAALGPYMVTNLLPAVGEAQQIKQQDVGRLQQLAQNNFEENLEPLSAEQIAKANTKGILALNQLGNAEAPVDAIKGGPHAHGNLESLLNIAVGLTLCFLAAPAILKQLVSWIFILGTLLHSGMLYLITFDVSWAGKVLGTGAGPILILIGLFLAGVLAAIWFRGEIVRDS
jgi:hypothetical protein